MAGRGRTTARGILRLCPASACQTVKNSPAMQETWVPSLSGEDPLEEGMATHSSVLAWRIPRTEEPGGLQSMGSQRVGRIGVLVVLPDQPSGLCTPLVQPRDALPAMCGPQLGALPCPSAPEGNVLTSPSHRRTAKSHLQGRKGIVLCIDPFSPPDRDRRVDSPVLS